MIATRHFNKLTPAQDERLALLLEECGEVIQMIGKIQRHGYDSYDPTDDDCPGNRRLLEKELGDVRQAIEMMTEKSDVSEVNIVLRVKKRRTTVQKYLHHQGG